MANFLFHSVGVKYCFQLQVNHGLDVYKEEIGIQQIKTKYIINEENPVSLIKTKVSCFIQFVALIRSLLPCPRIGQ